MKKRIFKKALMVVALIIMITFLFKAFELKSYSASYSTGYVHSTAEHEEKMAKQERLSEIAGVIGMELFVSIHMNAFVLYPLSTVIFKKNPFKGIIFLNVIRAAILLYCDFFVSTAVAIVDFFSVFIGAFIVIGLFILILYRGINIALKAKDNFSKYLAFGLIFQILIQAVMNLMVVIGLIPVTGVTLPFLSYGGSSLLISMISIGILLNISKSST